MKNKRLIAILATATILLGIPFLAMQFTGEVNWDFFDFFVMGVLLYGTGLSCELVFRRVPRLKNRLILCILLLLAFFLIWAELAVGVVGTPFAGN